MIKTSVTRSYVFFVEKFFLVTQRIKYCNNFIFIIICYFINLITKQEVLQCFKTAFCKFLDITPPPQITFLFNAFGDR